MGGRAGAFGGVFMGQRKARHKVPGRIDWQRVWTAEGRRAILWLPVLMGCGIWLYFALEREPDPLWCALTALPVAALIGYVLFAERPDVWVWVGGAVICASTIALGHRESRARSGRAR